jgi:hypothetical protein
MKYPYIVVLTFANFFCLAQTINVERNQNTCELEPMVIGNSSYLDDLPFSNTRMSITINYSEICSNLVLKFSSLNINQRNKLTSFGTIENNSLTTTENNINIRNFVELNSSTSFTPVININQEYKENIINSSTDNEIELGTFSISLRFSVRRIWLYEIYNESYTKYYRIIHNRNTNIARIIKVNTSQYEYPFRFFDNFKVITKRDINYNVTKVNANPFIIEDTELVAILSNNYQFFEPSSGLDYKLPLRHHLINFVLTDSLLSNNELLNKVKFEIIYTIWVYYLNSSGVYIDTQMNRERIDDRLNIFFTTVTAETSPFGYTRSPLFGGIPYESSSITLSNIRPLTTLSHELGHSLGLSHECSNDGTDDFTNEIINIDKNIMFNYELFQEGEDINSQYLSFNFNNIHRYKFTIGQIYLINKSKCSFLVKDTSCLSCGSCSNCNCENCPTINLNY